MSLANCFPVVSGSSQGDVFAIELCLLCLELLFRRDRERLVQYIQILELERTGQSPSRVQAGRQALFDPLDRADVEPGDFSQLFLRPLAHLPEEPHAQAEFGRGQQASGRHSFGGVNHKVLHGRTSMACSIESTDGADHDSSPTAARHGGV